VWRTNRPYLINRRHQPHPPRSTLVCNPISDHSEVLAFVERRLYAVIRLTVEDELVKRIHVIADPQKLEVIGSKYPTAGWAEA